MKRWLPLGICLLPGSAATVFVFLAIANGGQLFGISVEWLLNCILVAVPMLTSRWSASWLPRDETVNISPYAS